MVNGAVSHAVGRSAAPSHGTIGPRHPPSPPTTPPMRMESQYGRGSLANTAALSTIMSSGARPTFSASPLGSSASAFAVLSTRIRAAKYGLGAGYGGDGSR